MNLRLAIKRWMEHRPQKAEADNAANFQELPVSGIEHCDGAKHLHGLHLGSRVWLVRDPSNPADANAIRVETMTGHHIGYVNRDAAKILAQKMDAGITVHACVTLLECLFRTTLRIGVRLPLAATEVLQLPHDDAPTAFYLDERAASTYVMFNGSDKALEQVTQELARRGLVCRRHCVSTRLSADGHQYDWFVDVERNTAANTRDLVAAVFRECWDLHEPAEWLRAKELDGQLQQEIARNATIRSQMQVKLDEAEAMTFDSMQTAEDTKKDLADRLKDLKEKQALYERIQEERLRLREKAKRHNADLEHAILIALPSLEILRDPLRDVFDELADSDDLLNKLRDVAWKTAGARDATIFRSAPEWWELRYRRGHDNQGRLYFKPDGAKIKVLISRKGEQHAADEEYLKRH